MKGLKFGVLVLVLLLVIACVNPAAALTTSANPKFRVLDTHYYPNNQFVPEKVFLTLIADGDKEIGAVVEMSYDNYLSLYRCDRYEEVINDLLTIAGSGGSLDVDIILYGHETHFSAIGTKGYIKALTLLGMM